MRAVSLIVASTAAVFSAQAATLDISTLATGTQFTKCIKTTDFETKKITEPVEVADYLSSGCCPADFIPGVKHYNKYLGAQVICGFQDDGVVKFTTAKKDGATTCTYNKCFVYNLNGHTCKDGSKMTVNGCCPKDQWQADCKMYSKSQTSNAKKVNYCLSYAKSYKMEGTSDKKDDIATASTLNLDKLYVYTPCTGVWATGGGSGVSSGSAYTMVGDGACHNTANSPGTGTLKFVKSTEKVASACAAACSLDATCTGYDSRAAGCVYYKIAIVKSNAASTAYKCYKKGSAAVPSPASPAPASPTPASPTPASPTPASPTPASSCAAGKVCLSGKEVTCETEAIKTSLKGFEATFKNYKSCNAKTQKYTLEVSGYKTELQAGKNGNWNAYGIGMMCKDGNMYYIFTTDTKAATWDGLKEGKTDVVLLQCLLKEGSAGGGASDASGAVQAMSYFAVFAAMVSALL